MANPNPVDVESKTCCSCRTAKPKADYHRSRNAPDGLDPRCRTCRRIASTRHTLDDDLKRHGQMIRTYGITLVQFVALVEEQSGLCAICHQPETMTYRGRLKALCIDHDHDTGQVRGLLCSACNFALGKFRDDPALLRSAADYLER